MIVEILVSGKTGHMEETRPAFVHLWGRRPYNICSLLPNVSTSKYVHETTKKDGLISHLFTHFPYIVTHVTGNTHSISKKFRAVFIHVSELVS